MSLIGAKALQLTGVEAVIQTRLQKIFDIKKVTFNAPGEKHEQDTLFVQIARNRSQRSKNSISFNVDGEIRIFSQIEKLPLGFFLKKVDNADSELKQGFFFHSFDDNSQYEGAQNLIERKVGFKFLHVEQYDPTKGQIETLNLEIQ